MRLIVRKIIRALHKLKIENNFIGIGTDWQVHKFATSGLKVGNFSQTESKGVQATETK